MNICNGTIYSVFQNYKSCWLIQNKNMNVMENVFLRKLSHVNYNVTKHMKNKKIKQLLPFLLCNKCGYCCSHMLGPSSHTCAYSFISKAVMSQTMSMRRESVCQVNHAFQLLFLHQHLVWVSQAPFFSHCGPSPQSNVEALPFAVKASFLHILSSHC